MEFPEHILPLIQCAVSDFGSHVIIGRHNHWKISKYKTDFIGISPQYLLDNMRVMPRPASCTTVCAIFNNGNRSILMPKIVQLLIRFETQRMLHFDDWHWMKRQLIAQQL